MSDKLKEIINKQNANNEDSLVQSDDVVQLVGFIIGEEEYAVPILAIQEIIKPFPWTRVPQVPKYVVGVFNMRGAISLVDEMSKLLEKTWLERTASTLDKGLLPLLRKAVKTSVAILGVLIILGKWGVQIAPLLGALGIGGLAIALALNSSLSNVFAANDAKNVKFCLQKNAI